MYSMCRLILLASTVDLRIGEVLHGVCANFLPLALDSSVLMSALLI